MPGRGKRDSVEITPYLRVEYNVKSETVSVECMLRRYPERPGLLRGAQMVEIGARCCTGKKSVTELVPQDDTITSHLPSGLIPTLTYTVLKLTSVPNESPKQLGAVGADVRGSYVTPL